MLLYSWMCIRVRELAVCLPINVTALFSGSSSEDPGQQLCYCQMQRPRVEETGL